MSDAPALICVSPHPDDEVLGAGATLMALRDAGWRVVNLACSLGRPADRRRRHAELADACRKARFELVLAEQVSPIGPADDLALAQSELARAVADVVAKTGARLVVGPSPHDGHHGHEVVGRAIRDAIEGRAGPGRVLFWALWGELALPNMVVPFDAPRLGELQRVLASHAGELARTHFDRLLEARAVTNAVLGPERVFGFGTRTGEYRYAELLTDVAWSPLQGWRLAAPRRFDPAQPLAFDAGREVGWWLQARSARDQLGATRAECDRPRPRRGTGA